MATHLCQQQGVIVDAVSNIEWRLGLFEAEVFFHDWCQCAFWNSHDISNDGLINLITIVGVWWQLKYMGSKLVGLFAPGVELDQYNVAPVDQHPPFRSFVWHHLEHTRQTDALRGDATGTH